MPELYQGQPIFDDDEKDKDYWMVPEVDGEKKAKGLIPRDYDKFPQGVYRSAPPLEIDLIPESEWSDRIKEMERTKSRLSDIRRTSGPNGSYIPSLDQNGQGYCWAYSTTAGVMMTRAVAGLPYVRLSAHHPACIIKNYRDEGGWGALSCDFIREHGVASVEFWPEKSRSRSNDTPAMRENAKLHRINEGFWDLQASIYDRTLTWRQQMTLLLMRIPVVCDYNWWGHSVIGLDPVEVERGSFGIRILNSWTDGWGDKGEGVLRGSKARINGGVAVATSNFSNT